MAPEPDDRYQTARAFANDLTAFRRGLPVLAMAEDWDATRRTAPRVDDDTRRTTPLAAVPMAEVDGSDTRRTAPPVVVPGTTPVPEPVRKPRAYSKLMRVLAAITVACVAYGVVAGISDYLLYRHGRELSRQISTEQLTDPDQIYTRWTELSKGNPSSLLLYGPRKAVKQKLEDSRRPHRSPLTGMQRGAAGESGKSGSTPVCCSPRPCNWIPTIPRAANLRIAEGHLARHQRHDTPQDDKSLARRCPGFHRSAAAAAGIARPGTGAWRECTFTA